MPGSPRIAVVGVGAVGGVCSAGLLPLHPDASLCVRRSFRELVVDGPAGTFRARPRLLVRPEELASCDWLLLATKAHQIEGAAPWLEAGIGSATRVAVLQNGVEHAERVARWVEAARVLAVVVDCPCIAHAPGQIVQRRRGRLVVPEGSAGREFAALFRGPVLRVETSGDFAVEAWRKLAWNAAGGAIAALVGRPLPGVDRERRRDWARAVAREVIAVARAEGVDLPEDLAEELARACAELRSGGSPSTLADRRAGRPLEVDARNGVVVRLGRRHGIATPHNARLAALLETCHREPDGDRLPDRSPRP